MTIPRKTDFANIIKELGKAGVSQKELSAETGYSQAAFAKLGRGGTREPAWSIGDYLIRKHAEAYSIQSGVQ